MPRFMPRFQVLIPQSFSSPLDLVICTVREVLLHDLGPFDFLKFKISYQLLQSLILLLCPSTMTHPWI
jgi:hypothetical protein